MKKDISTMVIILYLLILPTAALAGSDPISEVLINLYSYIKTIAIPALAIGVVGLGGLLMARGMIALNRFIWFLIGGALIGGAESIVSTLFKMF